MLGRRCWSIRFRLAFSREPVPAAPKSQAWSRRRAGLFSSRHKPTPPFLCPPPGLRAGQAAMLQDSIDAAESAAGHPLKRGEVSHYWSAKARDYIERDPGGWLRLLVLKFRTFWSAFQYDDLSIVTILREQRVTFPGIYFGLVAAFALPAVVLGWKNAPAGRWVTSAIVLQMLALLPVFTTERYRLSVVPGLLVFAASGLVMFFNNVAAGSFRPALADIALLAVFTIVVVRPRHDPSLWAL